MKKGVVKKTKTKTATTKPSSAKNIAKISFEGTLCSPFSGLPDEGKAGADPTVLFVHYGNTGDYHYVSDVAKKRLKIKGEVTLSPRRLFSNLSLPNAIFIEVDAGWNGVNTYAFWPGK